MKSLTDFTAGYNFPGANDRRPLGGGVNSCTMVVCEDNKLVAEVDDRMTARPAGRVVLNAQPSRRTSERQSTNSPAALDSGCIWLREAWGSVA